MPERDPSVAKIAPSGRQLWVIFPGIEIIDKHSSFEYAGAIELVASYILIFRRYGDE
jgi:hypothetical protein